MVINKCRIFHLPAAQCLKRYLEASKPGGLFLFFTFLFLILQHRQESKSQKSIAQEWWAKAHGGRERRGGVGSQHTSAVTIGQIRFPRILLFPSSHRIRQGDSSMKGFITPCFHCYHSDTCFYSKDLPGYDT